MADSTLTPGTKTIPTSNEDAFRALLLEWMRACPNPPEWHWSFDLHVRTVNTLGERPTNETPEQRTDHAENLAKALEHYLSAHDTLNAVQDSDDVTGRGDASDCGLQDAANDAWRGMRTALHEYRKRVKKAAAEALVIERDMAIKISQNLREEYLHLRRSMERARDYLSGEFYAEALGVMDDVLATEEHAQKAGEPR